MSTKSDGLGPDPTSQALIRLVPKLGPTLATWRQETYDRQQQRVEKLGAAAAEGMGVEQFFAQVAADERLSDMFNTAVEAAIATSSDAKIRLLGRAMAAGAVAADQASVDEVEQLLRVAVELDPVDLRALRALERWRTSDPTGALQHALDVSEATAGPILARLERLHLVRVERSAAVYDKRDPDDDEVNIEERWDVTATAAAVLALIRERSDSRFPDAPRMPGQPWEGFTDAQAAALERLVELSHHDWRRQPQADEPVDIVLRRLDALNVSFEDARNAMRIVGFEGAKLEELDRWDFSAK